MHGRLRKSAEEVRSADAASLPQLGTNVAKLLKLTITIGILQGFNGTNCSYTNVLPN